MDDAPGHSTRPPPCSPYQATCAPIPEFRRLKYTYGQLLGVADFQAEQNYFREKQRLHNRCLHGFGVVCGLLIHPVPPPLDCVPVTVKEADTLRKELAEAIRTRDAETDSEKLAVLNAEIEKLEQKIAAYPSESCSPRPPVQISIDCGLAIDCCGDELIVRRSIPVDLWAALSPEERKSAEGRKVNLYLSLCYCEQPVDPFRPVISDQCGAQANCLYGKVRESVSVRVSLTAPEPDARCETCCEPCAENCLLLAKIVGFCPGHHLSEHQIHNSVRRLLSLYPPTTITGISWHTGRHYTPDQAQDLMGTRDRDEHRGRGLEIRFSRPVLASTIRPGVMDTWVIEGGRTRRGQIYRNDGEFVDKPRDGTVDRIFYRDTAGGELQPGDRVLVILLTDFILDECCRPVDGENVGGRVPTISEYVEKYGPHPEHHPHEEECSIPPGGYLPWTSGNGTPGGTFVSWFYIREEERERR
jgi:hypothetical protein